MNPHFTTEKTNVEVKNVNLGYENHGDSKKRRIDIDLNCLVDAEFLSQLAISEDDTPNYQAALFNEDGHVRQSALDGLSFSREYTDHVLVIGKSRYITKKIKKFAAKPADENKVTLSLQIQLYPEKAAALWTLTDMVPGTQAVISIEPPEQRDIEE